jgi:hypothetical protein
MCKEERTMTSAKWITGTCLSLLMIGAFAIDARAQQPPAPPSAVETPQTPSTPAPLPTPTPPVPRTEYGGQPTQTPPTNSQIDTRTEPRPAGESRGFLGVDPTLAMVLGAVVLIVVIIGLVSMSRRTDEVHDTTPHDTTRRHQI